MRDLVKIYRDRSGMQYGVRELNSDMEAVWFYIQADGGAMEIAKLETDALQC
jgi:hypothetical protein